MKKILIRYKKGFERITFSLHPKTKQELSFQNLSTRTVSINIDDLELWKYNVIEDFKTNVASLLTSIPNDKLQDYKILFVTQSGEEIDQIQL